MSLLLKNFLWKIGGRGGGGGFEAQTKKLLLTFLKTKMVSRDHGMCDPSYAKSKLQLENVHKLGEVVLAFLPPIPQLRILLREILKH